VPGPKARSSASGLISFDGVSGPSLKSNSRPSPDGFVKSVRSRGWAFKGRRTGQHLRRPDAAAVMTEGLTAVELSNATKNLQEKMKAAENLALIERADLQPGSIAVQLDCDVLVEKMRCSSDQINLAELMIKAPFQVRRRGVELKLHLGEAPPDIDRTLVQNIMKGRRWLALVIDGKTFSEIAQAEGVSKRRVQDVVNLALLAPDVVDGIAGGEQPDGLTTDYLIKTRFSSVWSKQREQFAAL